MSRRRRMTGRVKVPFSAIETMAASEIAENALAGVTEERGWILTRHSALYRCRDGRYTLCLVWHSAGGSTLTTTIRGLTLEQT